MATKGKANTPQTLAGLAGARDESAEVRGARGQVSGEPDTSHLTPGTFLVEVFSITEQGSNLELVETGRGQKLRAAKGDVEILRSPANGRHGQVRLQPGKFSYV